MKFDTIKTLILRLFGIKINEPFTGDVTIKIKNGRVKHVYAGQEFNSEDEVRRK
jgi:hypothetical protein